MVIDLSVSLIVESDQFLHLAWRACAALASLLPARNAAQLVLRETLACQAFAQPAHLRGKAHIVGLNGEEQARVKPGW